MNAYASKLLSICQCDTDFLDYGGNASGVRRPKKRSSGESPGDGQSLRSSGRQLNVRVKRSNNPPPGQVNAYIWTRRENDYEYYCSEIVLEVRNSLLNVLLLFC